jgi:transcriptional regulator with XRE-family HTH domain
LFPNLKAEMARRGVTGLKMAEFLGISLKTFYKKMSGSSEFKITEMFRIRDMFFDALDVDYLFKPDKPKKKKKSA